MLDQIEHRDDVKHVIALCEILDIATNHRSAGRPRTFSCGRVGFYPKPFSFAQETQKRSVEAADVQHPGAPREPVDRRQGDVPINAVRRVVLPVGEFGLFVERIERFSVRGRILEREVTLAAVVEV